jgi:hypothetical protein
MNRHGTAIGLSVVALCAVACGSTTSSLTAAPASSASSTPAGPSCARTIAPRLSEGTVTLQIGQRLCVERAKVGVTSIDDPAPAVLAPVPRHPGVFVARAAGTVVLTVTRRPSCLRHHECSQLIQFLGRIDVEVSG